MSTSQQTEAIGKAYFLTAAIKAGYGVAHPVFDDGIDLILFKDRPFFAYAVQLKVATNRIFAVHRKYLERDIYIAYVHNAATEPEHYLLPHDSAVYLLAKRTLESRSWLVDGRWEDTNVGPGLLQRLAPYKNMMPAEAHMSDKMSRGLHAHPDHIDWTTLRADPK
jgi:hypothetical protein